MHFLKYTVHALKVQVNGVTLTGITSKLQMVQFNSLPARMYDESKLLFGLTINYRITTKIDTVFYTLSSQVNNVRHCEQVSVQ